MGQEELAFAAAAAVLDHRAEVRRGPPTEPERAEKGQVRGDVFALECGLVEAEHVARGLVGHQHVPLAVRGEDSGRTGVDQHPQLLSGPALDGPASDQLRDKQGGSDEGRGNHGHARDDFAETECEGSEGLAQEGADERQGDILAAVQRAGGKEDGEQVEEAEGDIWLYLPVGEGDSDDEGRRRGRHARRAGLLVAADQVHAAHRHPSS